MKERERKRKAEKEKEEVYKFTPNIQILSFSLSALRLAFALQAVQRTSVSNNLDKFVLSSLPPPPLILQLKKFSSSYTPCTHPPQDHLLIIFASAKVYKYYNTAMEIVNAQTQRLGRQAGGRQCARRSSVTQISSSAAGSLLLLIQLLKIANSR